MLNRIYRVGHSLLHTNYLLKYLCSNYLISINTDFSSIDISLLIEGATSPRAIKFIYYETTKTFEKISHLWFSNWLWPSQNIWTLIYWFSPQYCPNINVLPTISIGHTVFQRNLLKKLLQSASLTWSRICKQVTKSSERL